MSNYPITVSVERREFEPGKVRSHNFEFALQIELEVPSKYNLWINCVRQFGRCAGRIPLGWLFERIETFDDGSRRWVEYRVVVIKGATPTPGFILGEKGYLNGL